MKVSPAPIVTQTTNGTSVHATLRGDCPTEATRRRIRVLHVLGSMNPGGVETWLMHVLRHIDRSRFELHFCTFGPEPGLYAREVEELGGKMIPCTMRKNIWSLSQRFRKILRAGRYDVVHSHVRLFSGAVLRWAHAEGVPMRIAHCHTTDDGKKITPLRRIYRRAMERWIEMYATHKLAASEAAANALFGHGRQGQAQPRVLYYGIDFRPFELPINRDKVRQELGIPANALVVGHVGRFVPAKNHHFLIQIAREIVARRPDVHFLLVGDGPLRAEIQAQATALGLAGRVHFTGARQGVARLICGAMDVFLFPSLWEGLGISLVEAQAAALRCAVSDTVPHDAAVLVEAVDYLPLSLGAAEWATLVLAKLDTPRLERGAALRKMRASSFSIERSVPDLEQIYDSFAEERRSLSLRTGA